MRIFTMPPAVGSAPEPNFYDSLQKVRLRQQLEMYSLCESDTILITCSFTRLIQRQRFHNNKKKQPFLLFIFVARKFDQQGQVQECVQLSME